LSSRFEDRTRPVREGEELDLEGLRPYLEQLLDEPLAAVEIEQFPGGHSNLTYALRTAATSGDTRELVLRRPPFGSKVKRAHDMGREYRVLSKLGPVKPWAPVPLGFCDDESVIGAEFYVMQRLHGVVLRRSVPDGMQMDEAIAGHLCETLIDTLVELHAVDYRAIGLADLGKPEGYVERQVRGWIKRYGDARTDQVEAMDAAAHWLEENMPASGAGTIIHNDYKFDNVVYDSERFERIVGVLDWEMATLGDPLMDLGTTLCYWVEPRDADGLKNLAFAPTTLPGMWTRAQLAQRYAEKSGRDLDDIVFYYVFGLYKTAVVLQQIYFRYQQGLTKDPRFAALNLGVGLLAERAVQAIDERAL
jgi:aminoglycoside phosphotransferase (APT) family kinase protein